MLEKQLVLPFRVVSCGEYKMVYWQKYSLQTSANVGPEFAKTTFSSLDKIATNSIHFCVC